VSRSFGRPPYSSQGGFPLRWDDDFPGYRRFHTADGNGNRVELLAELRQLESSPGNAEATVG